MYFNETGRLHSMPTSWTSVADDNPFQCASNGRSWFRVDDLLGLAALVARSKYSCGFPMVIFQQPT